MNKYRTIFISDTHLGGSCNYEALSSFLHENDADTWYIVGDFIDFWAVLRSKHWPQEATNILRTILGKAKLGAKVYIVPGNHDSQLRAFDGFSFGNVEIHNKMIHTFANGGRALVVHGDAFDTVIGHAVWLAKIGGVAYDTLIKLNTGLNWVRKQFHLPYWSFSASIKGAVKGAVNYVSDFKESIQQYADTQDVHGVICGHIHTADVNLKSGFIYINTGDWVESLTAVVEYYGGCYELKHYGR